MRLCLIFLYFSSSYLWVINSPEYSENHDLEDDKCSKVKSSRNQSQSYVHYDIQHYRLCNSVDRSKNKFHSLRRKYNVLEMILPNNFENDPEKSFFCLTGYKMSRNWMKTETKYQYQRGDKPRIFVRENT